MSLCKNHPSVFDSGWAMDHIQSSGHHLPQCGGTMQSYTSKMDNDAVVSAEPCVSSMVAVLLVVPHGICFSESGKAGKAGF